MGALLKLFTKALPFVSSSVGRFFKSKDAKERSIADWETEAIKASKGSWKDEFLTLCFASPIVLQVVGAIVYSFSGRTELLDAADMIYDSFARVGLDYTQVMLLIISASFGVHVTRTVSKNRLTKAAAEITKAKGGNIQVGPPQSGNPNK